MRLNVQFAVFITCQMPLRLGYRPAFAERGTLRSTVVNVARRRGPPSRPRLPTQLPSDDEIVCASRIPSQWSGAAHAVAWWCAIICFADSEQYYWPAHAYIVIAMPVTISGGVPADVKYARPDWSATKPQSLEH